MGAPGCVRVRRRGSWGQKTRTGSVGLQEEEVLLQLQLSKLTDSLRSASSQSVRVEGLTVQGGLLAEVRGVVLVGVRVLR